jgi:hypothetical protein
MGETSQRSTTKSRCFLFEPSVPGVSLPTRDRAGRLSATRTARSASCRPSGGSRDVEVTSSFSAGGSNGATAIPPATVSEPVALLHLDGSVPHPLVDDPLVDAGSREVRRERVAEGVVAAEDVPLRPLDPHQERLPRLPVGEHHVRTRVERVGPARVDFGKVVPHHRLDEGRHVHRTECLPVAAPLLLAEETELCVEVDVLDASPEEFALPGPGMGGGDKQRVEVASARFSLYVDKDLRDLGGVQEEPVPQLPLLPLVDPAAGEDRLNLVVDAKWFRLPLLREDEFDLGELRRDVALAIPPVPDEPKCPAFRTVFGFTG